MKRISQSGARRSVRSLMAVTGLVMSLMVLVPTATMAANDVKARVTASDGFTIGVGGCNGLHPNNPNWPYQSDGAVGFAPGTGDVQGGKSGLDFSNVDINGFLYIVTAGNDDSPAGIMGEFQAGTNPRTKF